MSAVIDLTHPYHEGIPVPGFFPKPMYRYVMDVKKHPLNVTEFSLVVHIGTHVDAPLHLFPEGESIEKIPLSQLCGKGVVIAIRKNGGEPIKVSDIGDAGDTVAAGDIVVLYTGWSEKYYTAEYFNHPYFSMELADWCVEKKVKLLCMDMVTPDMPIPLRPKGFNWPVHRRLLSSGVHVAENLTNLGALLGKKVTIYAAPIMIKGADGGPARIFAVINE
jgi:kynurenine formamidase